MYAIVSRKWYTLISSIGEMLIKNDPFSCFTVEDVARAPGVKIPKETAIPAGVYALKMTWSPRHNSMQPEIMNVPGFSGVRLDIANFASEVEGCIGVGCGRGVNAVWDSKKAHQILCEKLIAAEALGIPSFIEIRDEQEKKP